MAQVAGSAMLLAEDAPKRVIQEQHFVYHLEVLVLRIIHLGGCLPSAKL